MGGSALFCAPPGQFKGCAVTSRLWLGPPAPQPHKAAPGSCLGVGGSHGSRPLPCQVCRQQPGGEQRQLSVQVGGGAVSGVPGRRGRARLRPRACPTRPPTGSASRGFTASPSTRLLCPPGSDSGRVMTLLGRGSSLSPAASRPAGDRPAEDRRPPGGAWGAAGRRTHSQTRDFGSAEGQTCASEGGSRAVAPR